MGKRNIVIAFGAILALVIGFQVAAFASHPERSLTGSNFEIDTDANLIVDDPAPSEDWLEDGADSAIRSDVQVKEDEPSGQNDNSFGNGTKEDTAVPSVVDGGIPNNKSDLLHFGVYFEENTTSGKEFLTVFWHRVQEPTGTTNMDFEFNQSENLSANGETPVRTAYDILIMYDLSQGGTNPTLWLSKWVTQASATADPDIPNTAANACEAKNTFPCWGDRINLTSSGDAAGSINTSSIPANEAGDDSSTTDVVEGLGDISPRTFGEAHVDMDALVPPDADPCQVFGSAYLKSRSSDSFTAALKDFIGPQSIDIGKCGSVKIVKDDAANNATKLNGATFELRQDNAPTGTAPGAEDTLVDTCTTGPPDNAAGECSFGSVQEGTYWVVETAAPTGYDLPTPPYQQVNVTADQTVTVTFHDPAQKGAIAIDKTRKHAADGSGDHPHAGVTFTISDGNAGTTDPTTTTDAAGKACVDGLALATYNVIETVPNGYQSEDSEQTVTVNNSATCDLNSDGSANAAGDGTDSTNGETVSFHNTPLTDITLSVNSQVDGGTASTMNCGTPPGQQSTGANGDGSVTRTNLPPGTYTCTVVVDP